ncbi:MAG: hypothetical protein K8W52_16285 [Deltaproteobacteria bacterium]|nr:hypothetical protein [Deltaproteobacteria bacterium]
MKLHGLLGMLLAASISTAAHAAPGSAAIGEMVPNPALNARPMPTYIPIDSTKFEKNLDRAAGPPSRIIYLNNCKATNGCTVYAGNEDSRTQHSSIINGTIHLSKFAYSDSVWQQVVQCVKQTYAPFDVQITDVPPAAGVGHWENIVAGLPTEAGMQQGVGGVSPFTCGIIPNSITYTFANVYQGDVQQICWTVAQETAHSYGLDHEFLASDPMTYLDGSYPKRFQDSAPRCGEYSARQCQCGSATQNSYKLILQLFGSPTPTPPKVTIDDPANGAQVQAGFAVHASFQDDQGVDKTELYVDGKLAQTLSAPPYAYNAPGDLGSGTHHVEVRAYDLQGTPGSAFIDVVIGAPCSGDSCGDGKACIDGRCVIGPGQPTGLGEACTGPADCASGQCASDGAGTMYCVEPCDPAASGCPGNFDCLATDANGHGVCWPGAGDGGGGGCAVDDSSSGALPIGLGFAFLMVGLRRRRR